MVASAFRDTLLGSTILVEEVGILHRLRIVRLPIDSLQSLIRHLLISRCVDILMILQNIILNPLIHHFLRARAAARARYQSIVFERLEWHEPLKITFLATNDHIRRCFCAFVNTIVSSMLIVSVLSGSAFIQLLIIIKALAERLRLQRWLARDQRGRIIVWYLALDLGKLPLRRTYSLKLVQIVAFNHDLILWKSLCRALGPISNILIRSLAAGRRHSSCLHNC